MPVLQAVNVMAHATYEDHNKVQRNKAKKEYYSPEVKPVLECECTAVLPEAPEPHPCPQHREKNEHYSRADDLPPLAVRWYEANGGTIN